MSSTRKKVSPDNLLTRQVAPVKLYVSPPVKFAHDLLLTLMHLN